MSHLELAHRILQETVKEGDLVIDATCGNGHDTLFLTQLAPRLIYALDIQEQALESTHQLLGQREDVKLLLRCHSRFPEELSPGSVKAIVYNLGYLPGSDKKTTTKTETTLQSLAAALPLLTKDGIICVTCYPGHPEGAVEEQKILEWAATLDKGHWNVCHHRWLNKLRAPSLLLLRNCADGSHAYR